jgi:hypothetical protein
MRFSTSRARNVSVACFIVFAAGAQPDRARAQVAIGMTFCGDPFVFYSPQFAPSPTDYLNARSLAWVNSFGQAMERDTLANLNRESPNLYYMKVRDSNGESTNTVGSRDSSSARAQNAARSGGRTEVANTAARGPARQVPQPAPARPARKPIPLEQYFTAANKLDWPRDAPSDGDLAARRDSAETAICGVRDQVREIGFCDVEEIADARAKLIKYGQLALQRVRAERAAPVAVHFHVYLMQLYDSLEQSAEPADATVPAGG